MSSGAQSNTLVQTLRKGLLETLGRALGGAQQVALLEYPDHGNVGDSAIWLGERAALKQLGVDCAYVASMRTYRQSGLSRALDRDAVILMHGGGSFGDVWPDSQAFKQQILEDHRRRRVVFLPQTIHFLTARTRDEWKGSLEKHGNVTLMVRDRESLQIADELGANQVLLSPDAAFGLEIPRTRTPGVDVLWLLREDRESQLPQGFTAADYSPGDSRIRVDWPPDPFRIKPGNHYARAARYRIRAVERKAVGVAASFPDLNPVVGRRMDSRAALRLSGGVELLSAARVVVTDRLHGHILCLLLGIPHIALDNSYGKVSGFSLTWGTTEGNIDDAEVSFENVEKRAIGMLANGEGLS